eukprot:TRINITY_DN17341_c0_g1_i1.p2 TRINITY_DN17341_c0_g1~~TRINITY_DN17341_c0_g1_i1.p2  ORF type:complete len:206 (+),score=46.60 TRINITY_DN17341_c0_g1_i1:187-804(+)
MGASALSVDPSTSFGPDALCSAGNHRISRGGAPDGSQASCGLGSSVETATSSCRNCPRDLCRDSRDVHELRAPAANTRAAPSKRQLDHAQRVVDHTLQQLLLGKPVGAGESAAALDRARLSLSQDLRTLELQPAGASEDDASSALRRRMPLSQIADVSFGRGSRALILRFDDAMCMAPLELEFASEQDRLELAVTLKVLRARLSS